MNLSKSATLCHVGARTPRGAFLKLDLTISAKTQPAAPTSPRPNLDALYKPVGIGAITAATLHRKGGATPKGGASK